MANPGAGELEAELARIESVERRDLGVPPKAQLHGGPMSGPTPNGIPGGRLVTTRQIYELVQRTQGRKDLPMIFHCQSLRCWTSYNASLPAIQLGYGNVLWYWGGIEAWKHARLPIQRRDAAPAPPGTGKPRP